MKLDIGAGGRRTGLGLGLRDPNESRVELSPEERAQREDRGEAEREEEQQGAGANPEGQRGAKGAHYASPARRT